MTMNNEHSDAQVIGLSAADDECAERDPAALSLLFRSLADPTRLAVLRHLGLGEHRVVDLKNHLGLAQSTTSAHLLCLRDCGLISVRTVGRASVYSLAVGEELRALLSSAERLLAVTGDAVGLCPTNEPLQSGSTGPTAGPDPSQDAMGQDN